MGCSRLTGAGIRRDGEDYRAITHHLTDVITSEYMVDPQPREIGYGFRHHHAFEKDRRHEGRALARDGAFRVPRRRQDDAA
ncbi:protein of unknown function [Hyphomicrobium sp. MC1]|nr:protein of unknown function [Hyphomicrobium sp. MC1]